MEAVTWVQLFAAIAGVVVAAVGVAVAVWFGFLSRQDRGFDKLSKQMETYEKRNEAAHGQLCKDISEVRTTLQAVDGNVRELVGCFKERDRQQAAD